MSKYLLQWSPVFVAIIAVGVAIATVCLSRPSPALTATRAHAAPVPSLTKVNALVVRASHGRARAMSVFAGPAGLIGSVVRIKGPSGRREVVLILPSFKGLIVKGHLLSPDGKGLIRSVRYQQGLLLAPAKALAEAKQPSRHAILVGTSGPILTVLFDPNCIFCHLLYKKLQASVAAGKARLRVVLMGVIKPSSLGKAATILASPDPAKTLHLDEARFDVKHEDGGITVATSGLGPWKAVVRSNDKLLRQSGSPGTPVIFYCSASQHKVVKDVGLPRDLTSILSDAAPPPACSHATPRQS